MCNNYCCSLTKEYITCVYSIMALGCALDVANGYMTIVNMSAPVVQAIRGHGCAYGHPLDFLRTSSPVSVVTSVTIRSPQSSFDRPALRSNAHALIKFESVLYFENCSCLRGVWTSTVQKLCNIPFHESIFIIVAALVTNTYCCKLIITS